MEDNKHSQMANSYSPPPGGNVNTAREKKPLMHIPITIPIFGMPVQPRIIGSAPFVLAFFESNFKITPTFC